MSAVRLLLAFVSSEAPTQYAAVVAYQRRRRDAVVKAGLTKPATSHTFPNSFATHLLEAGNEVRTTQKFFGHRDDVKTTMIYTNVRGTAVRLAYVGRSMGHEDFHGGYYEDPNQ